MINVNMIDAKDAINQIKHIVLGLTDVCGYFEGSNDELSGVIRVINSTLNDSILPRMEIIEKAVENATP